MRNIEEIKADIEECSCFGTQAKLDALWLEWFRCLFYSIEPGRLEQLCSAEREQRAVVLPCKVGGIVYNRKGEKYFVTGISIADDIVISAAKDRDNSIWTGIQFEPFDIGVTVFLTPEAARAALTCQQCKASGDTKVCVDEKTGYVCPHQAALDGGRRA